MMSGKRRKHGVPRAPASWWAARVADVVAALAGEATMAEARRLLATGAALSMEAGTSGARALFRGEAGEPFVATFSLPPIPARARERAVKALAGKASFAAALLSGRIPEDVDEAFEGTGLALLPRAGAELDVACGAGDTSDDAPACPHVAALGLLLAERLDEDPFLAFALRGIPREELLSALRRHRADEPAESRVRPPAGTADAALELLPPARPDDFFRPRAPMASLRFAPSPPDPPDAVLARLGAPPLEDADASRLLIEMHRAIGLGARERLSEWEWKRLARRDGTR